MTDIVERLELEGGALLSEAAAEIERLRAEVERLRGHNQQPCPFGNAHAPSISPDDACPVCGDLSTGFGADGISRCGDQKASIRP